MENAKLDVVRNNTAIDITKLIMSFLVVAIHTEPFGFSFWLDKGFGIVTRLCVPFFFVASSYFFFSKDRSPLKYIKRIFTLYFIWSLIYLPFDVAEIKTMTALQIIVRYLWVGNGHALWYLCGSLVGFILVYVLSRKVSSHVMLGIGCLLLFIGCMKSTYAPILENIFHVRVCDFLGSRNGLFYSFVYYALGLFIAKRECIYTETRQKYFVKFGICFIALCLESIILVVVFKTQDTILWLSVLPLTYYFFMIIKDTRVLISDDASYFIRKCSTIIYVSHCFFIYIFSDLHYWKAFIVVSSVSVMFSMLVIFLGNVKGLKWLRKLS